jgi:REP element-mobilizing transposase RayT
VTDYKRFQKLLYVRNTPQTIAYDRVQNKLYTEIKRTETLVDIVAYALMPNHFHLLLRVKTAEGISTFMNKLCTSHAMYFNKKHERTGPLFCKPFRCKYISSDEYFRWVLSYIHLNPMDMVEINTRSDLQNYPFSSYRDYCGNKNRQESLIIQPDKLPFASTELEQVGNMREVLAVDDL